MREVISLRFYFDQELYQEHDDKGPKAIFVDIQRLMDRDNDFIKYAKSMSKVKKHVDFCYGIMLKAIKSDLDNDNIVLPFAGLHGFDPEDEQLASIAKTNGHKKTKERTLSRLMVKNINDVLGNKGQYRGTQSTTVGFVEFSAIMQPKEVGPSVESMDFDDNFDDFYLEPDVANEALQPCADCAKYKEQICSLETENIRLKQLYDSARQRLTRQSKAADSSDAPVVKQRLIFPSGSEIEAYRLQMEADLQEEKSARLKAEKELSILQTELNNFGARGSRNELSPGLIEHIMGLTVQAHMSTRQVQNEFLILKDSLPVIGRKNYLCPSLYAINKVQWCVPYINDLQTVQFLNDSSSLCVSFDGTTKNSAHIFACLIVNEFGDSLVLDAKEGFSSKATDNCDAVIDMFVELSLRADVPDSHAWFIEQLEKITMLMSDSCPEAQACRRLLAKCIKATVGDKDKYILEGDCSMHMIMNGEKKAAQCLSVDAKRAIQIVHDVLAGNCLEYEKVKESWELFVNDKKFTFDQERGCRFGSRGLNAAKMALKWTELIAFVLLHPANTKLQELKSLLANDTIKEEIIGLATIWVLVLDPLWTKLRPANVKSSIEMLDSFVKLYSAAQNVPDPMALITDPSQNQGLRVSHNGSYSIFYYILYTNFS